MIAIPNINKPKSCCECPIAKSYLDCLMEKKYVCPIGHTDDCPLIEIIQCGECKWWNRDGKRKDGKGWCENAICGLTKPNAFCSYGERSE